MVPISYTHNLQHRSRRGSKRLGAASIRLIGIVLLALLGLLYIAQSSQATTKRVELQHERSAASDLDESNRQLMLDIQRRQSLDTISQSASQLGLEPIDSVEFLQQ